MQNVSLSHFNADISIYGYLPMCNFADASKNRYNDTSKNMMHMLPNDDEQVLSYLV